VIGGSVRVKELKLHRRRMWRGGEGIKRSGGQHNPSGRKRGGCCKLTNSIFPERRIVKNREGPWRGEGFYLSVKRGQTGGDGNHERDPFMVGYVYLVKGDKALFKRGPQNLLSVIPG